MSLQLPTILSPPTPCIPVHTLTVLAVGQVAKLPSSLPGRSPFWASPFPSGFANASSRIEFIIFLIMDWLFAAGCSPPRLSTTQLPSATDRQCSVRWGLSPHCWCALSGALGADLRAARRKPPCHTSLARILHDDRRHAVSGLERLIFDKRCCWELAAKHSV